MKFLTKFNVFGLLNADGIKVLKVDLPDIAINSSMFSSIARPTATYYQGKIWEMNIQD